MIIGFNGVSDGKESACKAADLGLICGLGRSPEKEMANSSILAWRNPWTEEPGRPQAMGVTESDMTDTFTLV